MAASFDIQVQGSEALVRRLLEIGQDAPRAATRALNRTLGTVRTATVRALAAELALRNKDVTDGIATQRASFARQIATLSVTGRRLPLSAFGARQTRRGVTYRLPKGRGTVEHAFLATMRSGHGGVFLRKGKPRLPIRELFGPSLPGAFVRAGIRDAMVAKANAELAKNLTHEIDWIIRQRAQGSDGAEGV